MRSTLAFLAGILVGFLLAWASGPFIVQRVHDWPALLQTELADRIRVGQQALHGRFSVGILPSEKPFPASVLRRPVNRSVRMARSDLILALPVFLAPKSTAAVDVVLEDVHTDAANASNASLPILPRSTNAVAVAENTSDVSPGEDSLAGPVSVSRQRPGSTKSLKKKDRAVDPKGNYDRALRSYQSGRYAVAREQFAAFMNTFPRHALVPNALYWSGETWYAQARYDRAAEYFAQVVRDHPRHAKSPDALLKLAYSAMRQGRLEQAKIYLRELETLYPDSPASQLGRQARTRLEGQNGSSGMVLAHG